MIRAYKKWLVTAITILAVFAAAGREVSATKAEYYSPDLLAMQGSWVRADAPYVIELKQGADNKLQARYFNRRYIHVEKTETAKQDGLQFVMIQLQDTNYAGSVYLLSYNRNKDALNGVYIHGASGQRFSVTFSRQISQKNKAP